MFIKIADILSDMVYRKESPELINGLKADIQEFFKQDPVNLEKNPSMNVLQKKIEE